MNDDLRSRVAAEYDLSTAHALCLTLFEQACRTEETICQLEDLVASDGLLSPGSQGQTRIHPAVQELRAQRAAYARLLIQCGLDDHTTSRTARYRGRG